MNILEKRLKERFPQENLEVLQYTKMREFGKIKCLDCGTIYEYIRAENVLMKTKRCVCKKCGNVEYKTIDDFLEGGLCKCRRFNVPKTNTFIEFQGIQHFQPVPYFGGKEKFERQQKFDILKKSLL